MSKAQRLITTLLTVNAILLAALLGEQITGQTVFAQAAYADPTEIQSPNAGLQRERMIRQLAEIQKAAQATQKVLETGTVKVVVQPPKKPPK